jgi:hypothetical protein
MKLVRVNMGIKEITAEQSKEEYRLLGNRGLIAKLAGEFPEVRR